MNKTNRKKIIIEKLRKLPTVNEDLDGKYGMAGTGSREIFSNQAHAYYTGQLIGDARRNAHLTQEELAIRVGAHKSYISRIENGKTEPKVSKFYRIAAALGLSVDLNPI